MGKTAGLLATCKTCQAAKSIVDFEPTPTGRRRMCRECRRKAFWKPRVEAKCAQCNELFLKPRADSRFCSSKCYGGSRRRLMGAKPRGPIQGTEKACTRCKEVKPVDAFPVQKRWGQDQPSCWCRECVNDDSRKRRGRNREGKHRRGEPLPPGATHVTGDGYVIVKAPDHHRAGRNGWVLQHIVVAEEKYGFPITKAFTVHHKNADRADNRPENLELRLGNHGINGDLIPTILRIPEFRQIARHVLAQYDD